MVLSQSASQDRSFHIGSVHPNPTRIAGMAGAIALNLAVVMALLIPMDLPTPQFSMPEPWIIPVEDTIKPKPKPPEPVPVTRPQTQQQKPVEQRTVTKPVENPPVVSTDQRAVDVPYVPPVAPSASAAVTPSIAPGPVAGVRLEYETASPPPYPRRELAAGTEGSVMLKVLVDVDGTPLDVSIHSSSGNRNLDRAAREHVLKSWKFRPAMRDGQPIQAIGLVPIDFSLQ